MPRRLIIWIASLAVWLSGSALAVEPTTDSLDTVKKNLADGKAILLDVREQRQWDAGHLAQAQLLPNSALKAGAKDPAVKAITGALPKDKIIYTHCAKGVRAVIAGNVLEELGYQVRPLAPGYDVLRESGFPLAK